MTTFKQFITEDWRTTISLDEAVQLVATHCRDSLKAQPIYRGIDIDSPQSAYTLHGESGGRKSANTSNHYTVILDHVLTPLGYPKRSASSICSTDMYRASEYGYVYRIYPYDGVKIGVCPHEDMFYTTVHVPQNGTSAQVNRINRAFMDSYVSAESFDKLVETCVTKQCFLFGETEEEIKKNLEKYYSPAETGFELHTTADFHSLPRREVWIGGKVIAVRNTFGDDFDRIVRENI